jgi:hypothetical protein
MLELRMGNKEELMTWISLRHYQVEMGELLHTSCHYGTSSHSCIVLPPTNATHYDLKPHVIQMLPSFYSLDHENPYSHVKKFKNICATTKFQNFYEEAVHLCNAPKISLG